ncbi:MAG: metal-dependent transcriptional regulator [Firmicutes bacterium]|jgi:DtxR family Mn-dependent transcriptional regulator|nr:metal-dependent transcriptional regulator [Bacillota bacterium]MDD6695229.1 metal-dependent transcriptional regulator [Bacillota bacterium]MDY3769351.1 metal-dependent transcriptional regulator [Lachnospiraceae bacterium]
MQQSGQTYLETIYLLKRENGHVKSIDVAKALGFSKPSVSRAMGKLKAEGYLEVGEKGELVLTKEGNKIAKDLVEKQETLTQFLMMTADVDQETAEDDARKMMHFISKKSFQGIRNFIKQVEELN